MRDAATGIVGRDREVRWLADRIAAGRSVVVVGAAGVGKSTLLRAAVGGRRALAGGGLAGLRHLAHIPLIHALGGPPPPGDNLRVADHVASIVGDGVLVIDDLHWADPDTLAVLGALAGRITLLAGVRRGDPGEAAALAAFGPGDVRVRAIGPLSATASRDLVARHRPGLPETAVRELLRQSGGNPLLLRRLDPAGTAGDSLRAWVAGRLRPCSPRARTGMSLLAVAGRPLATVLLGDALGELVDAGLVEVSGGHAVLQHALLGDAVLRDMPPADLRSVHRSLADTAEDPAVAAPHHAAAGRRARARAAALAAAGAATRPGERARMLALAAELAPPARREELCLAAAGARLDAGDPNGALAQLEGLDPGDPLTRADVALHRSRAHYDLMHTDACLQHADIGLALVPGPGTAVEARLRLVRARAILNAFEPCDDPVGLVREAAAVAHAAGLPPAPFVEAEAWALCRVRRFREARARFHAVRRAAARDADVYLEGWALWGVHWCALHLGRIRVATVAAERARRRADAAGLAALVAQFAALRAAADLLAGRLDDAVRTLEELEPLPSRFDDGACVALAEALAWAGRDGDARRCLRRLRAHDDAEAVTSARGTVALAAGRYAEALPAFDALLAASTDTLAWSGEAVVWRNWAALRTGAPILAYAAADGDSRFPAASERTCGAQIAMARGRFTEAAAAFILAAGQWSDLARRDRLGCLLAAGEAWLLAGDAAAAREILLAAEAEAGELGWLVVVRRCAPLLRRAGVRRAAPRSRAEGGLTARQREMLRLVAEGLTTPQIAARLGVSASTVDRTVTTAMHRLGARTRRQAAALAAG